MKYYLYEATKDIDRAREILNEIIKRGSYTNNELKEVRKLLLEATRKWIDPVLGHMPNERHY